MMDLLTPQTVASAGPILLDTLFRHVFSHKSLMARSTARGDDLMYDEAFVLMKTFLESATKYPLVSLQRFSNVRTPAPPWVGVHRVTIPAHTLHQAAKHLIEAFGGPEMTYKIAGGSRWWQVRAGGLEGEWIAMKKDYEPALKEERERQKARRKSMKAKMGGEKKAGAGIGGEEGKEYQAGQGKERAEPEDEEEDDGFRQEMDEMRCMLYIHGGAYYWGSINTHRYTIWRYARKMRGRCFALNYRKAPQYPFPCAIQDCLAAYLYLVDPPPGAPHRPVKPEHIVIAGDSAGGGLTLALLQILRDVQALSLPAGAALISPKPSSLWPPPPTATTSAIQSGLRQKVRNVASKIRHGGTHPGAEPEEAEGAEEFGELYAFEEDRLFAQNASGGSSTSTGAVTPATAIHNDQAQSIGSTPAKPSASESGANTPARSAKSSREGLAMVASPFSAPPKFRSSEMNKSKLTSFFKSANATLHPTTHRKDPGHSAEPQGEVRQAPSRANPAEAFGMLKPLPALSETGAAQRTGSADATDPGRPTTLANCSIPLRLSVHGEKVEIDTQVQIYATNAQLCHPLVSPALGYLGRLCPLFIMCGDNEVLRDEIIYLAHKAAEPEKFPIRDDVRAMMPHYEGIEELYQPTKVHLQVYDGVCHDLPLFSMCRSARGLFRAVSTFARHVTPSASNGSRSSASSKAQGRTKSQPQPVRSLGSIWQSSRSPLGSDVEVDRENDDGRRDDVPDTARSDPTGATTELQKEHTRRGSWWVSAKESTTPGKLSRRSSRSAGMSTSGAATPAGGPISPGLEREMALQGINEFPVTTAEGIVQPITGIDKADGASVPLPLPAGSAQGPELARRLERLNIPASGATGLAGSEGASAVLPSADRTASPAALTPATQQSHASVSASASEGVPSHIHQGPAIGLQHGVSAEAKHSGQVGTASTGDESGPRWAHEPGWEGPAKEGEAGHPSVYARQDAWQNNMIRERVDSHGVLRPLEPASELGALQMPADEIGTIKEGPALRYLTGQYLWDKKYSHARKTVARHRQKNLKAHAKDVGKLVEGVKRRLGKQQQDAAVGLEAGRKSGGQGTAMEASSAPISRVTSGSTVSTVSSLRSEGSPREQEGAGANGDEYEDWSWAWALNGDVPPPSAIVSRRDTAEARKLALTADHADSAKGAQFSGLSIWVALTTFFSNSAERNRAKDVIQAAKEQEERKAH